MVPPFPTWGAYSPNGLPETSEYPWFCELILNIPLSGAHQSEDKEVVTGLLCLILSVS
jgi:hypothetical protein